jgi:hypothetical protein
MESGMFDDDSFEDYFDEYDEYDEYDDDDDRDSDDEDAFAVSDVAALNTVGSC